MTDEHPVPRGLKAAGRRLWRSTVAEFVLAEHELALLLQVCRTADACEALQGHIEADGVLDESPQGRRAHPALVELRQQRTVFARLIAQLGIPVGEESNDQGGRRRAYGIRVVS